MPSFLEEFFPVVYKRTQQHVADDSNYCKYNNESLQLFTSSLYLAALIATFFASYTTRVLGRKKTMLIAGVFFIVGTILNAAAVNLLMLILGRISLGCGVGFANQVYFHSSLCYVSTLLCSVRSVLTPNAAKQAVPLFLSEIAPTRIRGALNILFQFDITVGILFANLINYGTSK